MTPRPSSRATTALVLLPALLLAGAFPSVHAQVAPAPAAAKPSANPNVKSADDEVIDLTPFEVKDSKDDKWNASSTLLGNRTNQELLNLPISVEVMTRDFMDDIGVFNMEDAAMFVAGVSATPRLEARNDNGRITFRGLNGSSNTSRNFFQWAVPSDTYNVDRFDFGKGSNSLMFGDATPGGQVTTTTKRARFNNLGEVQGIYDSLGSYRLQFDVNRKLTKQLAVRLNAVNREDKAYVTGSYQRFRAADFSVAYRPFKDTIITVEGERGLYQRRRADNTAAIHDVAATGRAFASANKWYVTSDGEVINRTPTATSEYPIQVAPNLTGTSGNVLSLLEGQSAGVRLPNGSQKVFHGLARTFNILGLGDYLDRPFNVVTAMVEQNIGKLSLQFSYNQQFQHQDRNDNSFGAGNTSPPLIDVDGNGRPYTDMSGNLTAYKVFGEIFKAGRVSALYPFQFGNWMKQALVLTGTRTKDYAYNRRFGLANTAAAGLAANNAISYRAYLDDPTILYGNGFNRFVVARLPHTATFNPEMVESYVNTGPFIDIRYTQNYTASLSGEYFGGRLMSLIGISDNKISRKIPTAAAYATDAKGFVTFFKTPDEAPSFFQYDPNFTLSARSLTSGLNYTYYKGENFTGVVYANYTESFNWQSQLIFTGRNLGPITGTTREAGLKSRFFQNKIEASVAVYKTDRQNAGFAWAPNSLTNVQLEDLFNPNNIAPADSRYLHIATGLNNESHEVNSTEQSKGVEFSLTSQRIGGLQSRINFSKIKVTAARDFSEFQALLAAAVARTTAANATGGDRTQAETASNIAAAQDIVAQNVGTVLITGRRSAPYTGSFAFDYSIARITGLRVGLTGTWTPKYNLALINGVIYKGGAALPLNLYATYDRKLWNHRTTFRAGFQRVYDLLQGDSYYYKTGTTGTNAVTKLPNYLYRYTDSMVSSASVTVWF